MNAAQAVDPEIASHDVKLTVHRSADQIGGNCIEICAGDHRLILDVGRPLDAPKDAVALLPETLDRDALASILISHPIRTIMACWTRRQNIGPSTAVWRPRS
jgi:ribonuclease J